MAHNQRHEEKGDSSIQKFLFRSRQKWEHSYKVNRLRTGLHRALMPSDDPRIIFIFGCQRSGTTLLRNFIGLDPRVLDIGEGDPPFFETEGERYLRLKPDEVLGDLVRQTRHPHVLLKPLHDTQRASGLLQSFPDARGIGIFRHFLPVVDSHLRYYRHDPLKYLRPLIALDQTSWMLEGLDKRAMDQMTRLVEVAGTNPPDLYGVFWWVRNMALIEQAAGCCLFLSYEDLVLKPEDARSQLDLHLALRLKGLSQAMPHQGSLERGRGRLLHPMIQDACNDLLNELRAISSRKCIAPSSGITN